MARFAGSRRKSRNQDCQPTCPLPRALAPSEPTRRRFPDREDAVAEAVGRRLAERGHAVVCGGRGGVMEAACRGAAAAGGHTVGILPGADRRAANEHVETAIATGMGNARNVLVVLNGDAAIAVSGSTGTLSEIGHALDSGRPVAGLGTHDVPGVEAVETPRDAVDYVEAAVGRA